MRPLVGYIMHGGDIVQIHDYSTGSVDIEPKSEEVKLIIDNLKDNIDCSIDSYHSGVAGIYLDKNDELQFSTTHGLQSHYVTVMFELMMLERLAGDVYDSIVGRFYIIGGRIYPINDIVEKTDKGYVLTEDALCVNCQLVTPICKVDNPTDYDHFAVNNEINAHIMQHPLVKGILEHLPDKSYGYIISSLVVTNPSEVLTGEPLKVAYPLNDEYGIGTSIHIESNAN